MSLDKRSKKIRFTATRINNFTCPQGITQAFIWDSTSPGLGVRCTQNSNKAYIFQSRYNNKSLRITIGSVNNWSLSKAQNQANSLQVLIDRGEDPRLVKAALIEEKQKESEAKTTQLAINSITVADAWNDYYLEKSSAKKDGKLIWGEKHKAHLEHFIQPGGDLILRGKKVNQADKKRPGILYPLMRYKLSELDENIITSWLKKESISAPTSTAKAYSVLRAFMNWCAEKNKYKYAVNVDVIKSSLVKNNVSAPKAKKNDNLRKAQLGIWFSEVKKINNPIIAAYLQCLLLTGARRNELASIRWTDIDLKWKSMVIKDKVEGERTIPLTPYVEYLISSLPKRNQYVFSSLTSQSGRLEEPRKQHTKVIKNAGLPPLSLHGLRRSFGTLSEWVEVPTGIVAQIMGHKPSAIAEKHYIQRELDLLEIWHQKIESWILKEAHIKFTPSQGLLRVIK